MECWRECSKELTYTYEEEDARNEIDFIDKEEMEEILKNTHKIYRNRRNKQGEIIDERYSKNPSTGKPILYYQYIKRDIEGTATTTEESHFPMLLPRNKINKIKPTLEDTQYNYS